MNSYPDNTDSSDMNLPKWNVSPLIDKFNDDAQDFYTLIKEKFSFLTEKYGFDSGFEKIPHQQKEDAVIVFQSDQGRILFSWNRMWGMYIYFALGASPLSDCGATVEEDWVYAYDVLKFLDIEFEVSVTHYQRDNPDRYAELIGKWEKFLSPHWEKIIAIFSDPAFARKYENYRPFRRREIKNLHLSSGQKKLKSIFEGLTVLVLLAASFLIGLGLLTVLNVPQSIDWLVMIAPVAITLLFLYLFRYLRHKDPF